MITYIVAGALMVMGLCTFMMRRSLLKKIIGMSIFTNGIHLLFISIGYKPGGVMPIRTDMGQAFLSMAVDPIPQALVLTSIVINLSVSALAVSMLVMLHDKKGTIDSERIRGEAG